jgi:hypothetical protein
LYIKDGIKIKEKEKGKGDSESSESETGSLFSDFSCGTVLSVNKGEGSAVQ